MAMANIEKVKTLERGDVFFFFRPEGESAGVERVYVIMKPYGREEFRRAVISRRHQPDGKEHEHRHYSAVTDLVTSDPEQLLKDMPAARPLGEGRYSIIRHADGYYADMHTHFIYQLDAPPIKSAELESFRIDPEASYVLTVTNPETPSSEEPVPADPVFLLDREGIGFELAFASTDLEEEFGLKLDIEHEETRSADVFRELRMNLAKRPVKPLKGT